MIDVNDYIIRIYIDKNGRVFNNKLYAHYCDTCGVHVAYRSRVSKLTHSCKSCNARARLSDSVKNPMFGKKHKNRERFRKNTYNNVNYDDVKVEYSKTGNKRTKFRQRCPICDVDVGYRVHFDATRKCVKCQGDVNRKNSVLQRRIKSSMKANLVARLKNRLLNKNKKSTFDILDYTVEELKNHLESKFQEGMTWENYGEWHIDHVIPDSWFHYTSVSDDDFKKSWNLNNLQPLWAKDNLRKSNKYEG